MLVARLRRNPDATVVIKGHTVGRGDPGYNRTLGQRRADAVAAELLKMRIAPRRILALGAGRAREYKSLTAWARQERRRAALTLVWGNVVEFRYPALLMDLQLAQRAVAA
jgi:outer membrane protein OmpA-like peptidoglycan-associated protein